VIGDDQRDWKVAVSAFEQKPSSWMAVVRCGLSLRYCIQHF